MTYPGLTRDYVAVQTMLGMYAAIPADGADLLLLQPGGSDGRDKTGIDYAIQAETDLIAPGGFGGECVFAFAHLTCTWTARVQLQITPIIDESVASVVLPLVGATDYLELESGGAIDDESGLPLELEWVSQLVLVKPTLILPQQPTHYAEPQLPQRITDTFAIPLVRKVLDGAGRERSRVYCRGATCRLLIESVGTIGTGDFRIDAMEIEHQVVRKATYRGQVISG